MVKCNLPINDCPLKSPSAITKSHENREQHDVEGAKVGGCNTAPLLRTAPMESYRNILQWFWNSLAQLLEGVLAICRHFKMYLLSIYLSVPSAIWTLKGRFNIHLPPAFCNYLYEYRFCRILFLTSKSFDNCTYNQYMSGRGSWMAL